MLGYATHKVMKYCVAAPPMAEVVLVANEEVDEVMAVVDDLVVVTAAVVVVRVAEVVELGAAVAVAGTH